MQMRNGTQYNIYLLYATCTDNHVSVKIGMFSSRVIPFMGVGAVAMVQNKGFHGNIDLHICKWIPIIVSW